MKESNNISQGSMGDVKSVGTNIPTVVKGEARKYGRVVLHAHGK